MKRAIFVFFIFLTFSVSAKEDEDFFKKIESLTSAINQARKSGDLEKEIELLYERFQLNTITLNHNQSYVWGLELEDLIDHHEDLEIVKKIKQPYFSRMGWLFNTFSEYETSIEYYQISVAIADQEGNVEAKYKDLGAIAFTKFLLGDKEKALHQLDNLMQEVLALGNDNLKAEINYRFYTVWVESDPKKALAYAHESLNTSDTQNLSHRLTTVGNCYAQMGELDSALFYTNQGLQLAKENVFYTQESNALILLVSIYSQLGDFEKALENFKVYHMLQNDAMAFQSGMKLMTINQKTLEEKLMLQESLAEEKLINQRVLLWIFVFFTLILGIILFLLYKKIMLTNQQKKRIEEEKIRAEQSEQYVEQFLISLSHEIRTPMHAISGMVNALLRNPESNFKDEYLEAMRISSDNLLILLNDILDLAKIESGKMQLILEQFKPVQVAMGVIHLLKFKASEKGLELAVDVAEDFPEKMVADSSHLSQILINLLGNAIKFTDQGNIRLIMSKVGEYARFVVQDTGIGIPEEKLQLIFNSFEQLGKEQSRKYEGTGLGLSISKKLIELQGGRIWVESEQGKGSRFIFELPIHSEQINLSDAKIIPQLDLRSLGEKLKGIRILLVDDDVFNMMVVQDDLTFFIPEVSIIVAKSGEEALQHFEKSDVDLVLMDIHMPGMGGIAAAKKMRDLESLDKPGKRTPIIAITANIVHSEINKFMNSGMDDYIPKPYKVEEILGIISHYFQMDLSKISIINFKK
ncbi:ATP-binding protein [Aquiflexum sp. TKW24L]|uniref:tetratricopeptide repeat-containing hybrid sensor histidine kinase/response regulator n=1 Tax=Aquiflexum sp. TKW24L TaxID=2942212 RepID=UPI0020BFDAD1|nr:ATP-binding protein [Aquiflexum sp. TKW24L]MCL6259567.1 ATP-binding protein [Aquiflexum sp. TKW24L]